MLEFSAMSRQETGFSFGPQVKRKTRTTNQIDLSIPMNFLGSMLRERQDCLKELTEISRHILLARSDIVSRPTYRKLGRIFGKSEAWIMHVYKNSTIEVWNAAPVELQNKYPLTAIFDSNRVISPETRTKLVESHRGKTETPDQRKKIGEGVKISFKKPEIKKKIIVNAAKRQQSPEVRTKISKANSGRTRTLEQRIRMGKSQTKRYQKPEEREQTSQAVIRSSVRRKDKGKVNSEDASLWSYAVSHNLIDGIINGEFLTEDESNSLKTYFKGGPTPKNLPRLLDKLSLGVARLA
jgi:hypothetical protein